MNTKVRITHVFRKENLLTLCRLKAFTEPHCLDPKWPGGGGGGGNRLA